jgi:hypothetical protein
MTWIKFVADFEVRTAHSRRRPCYLSSSAERGAKLRKSLCARAQAVFLYARAEVDIEESKRLALRDFAAAEGEKICIFETLGPEE